MRLDRHDIFPLSVVLFFGFLIPLAAWLGLATRQQIARDFSNLVTTFAIAGVGLALFVAFFAIRSRKREKVILAERGEQSGTDFAAQFARQSEQHAATITFQLLQRMTAMKRMPRLERSDHLNGPPLLLDPDDLAAELESLFEELDFSLALDPDGAAVLHEAKTIEQLVFSLAHFVERQGAKPVVVGDSDR